MKVYFDNDSLEDLFQGESLRKPRFNREIVIKFIELIESMRLMDNVTDLKSQRSLNFEALKGNLKGKYSVRVNRKYRLIFRIEKSGQVVVEEIIVIEDLSNHYK